MPAGDAPQACRRCLKPPATPIDRIEGEGDWRKGWDSNPVSPFRFCKLQILKYRRAVDARDAVAPCPLLPAWQKVPIDQ